MSYYYYYGAARGAGLPPGQIPDNTFQLGANVSGMESSDDAGSTFLDRGFSWREADAATVTYLISKGFTCFRLPFKIERAQNDKSDVLDETFMSYVDEKVTQVTNAGLPIALDAHNYMRRRGADLTDKTKFYINVTDSYLFWNGSAYVDTAGAVASEDQFLTADFVDFWERIADRYKDNPRVLFDLMNEPINNHTTAELITIFNAVIAGIRGTGATNRIYVPWTNYQSAATGVRDGAVSMFTGIVDSGDNVAFTAHQYFDPTADGGGADIATIASENIASYRLWTLTEAARKYNKKILLGESGIAGTAAFVDGFFTEYTMVRFNTDVYERVTFWTSGNNGYPTDAYAYRLNPGDATPTVEQIQMLEIGERIFKGKNYISPDVSHYWDVTGLVKGVSSLAGFFDFTRASLGWDWNGGTLQEYAVNELRLSVNGLRIEPERTNYFTVDDFTGNGYTAVDTCAIEGGATPVLYDSDNGENWAVNVTEGTGTGTKYVVLGAFATDNATTHIVSCYHKTYEEVFPWLQASAGTVIEAKAIAAQGFTTFRYGDWFRQFVNVNSDAGGVKVRTGFNDDATAPGLTAPASYTGLDRQFYAAFPQIEEVGASDKFPTSPIITLASGSPVTRAADVAAFKSSFITAMNGDFTLVLSVNDLPAFGIELPILVLNGTIDALKITAAHKVSGDFGGTITTADPFALGDPGNANYTASGFRNTSRKFGISVRQSAGRVVIGGQGIDSIGQDVTVPAITSARLGYCAGRFDMIAFLPYFLDSNALREFMLRENVVSGIGGGVGGAF